MFVATWGGTHVDPELTYVTAPFLMLLRPISSTLIPKSFQRHIGPWKKILKEFLQTYHIDSYLEKAVLLVPDSQNVLRYIPNAVRGHTYRSTGLA